MTESSMKKEQLCLHGAQAGLTVEIGKEAGEETAGEKGRKDNKGEGASCQCPLRKSPPSGSPTALLNYICLFSQIQLVFLQRANKAALILCVTRGNASI